MTLACLLALIGWVNSGCTSDVADRCQQLYENGQYEQAFPVCSEAAEQGDVKTQNILGLMYYFGRGVQQDYAEAVKWYRKAAEQGDAAAQFCLGGMYAQGKGVKQDYAETVKWLRKAAGQGDADSQFCLGDMYARGEGVMQSGAAAADWFYKAGLSFLKGGRKDDALMCVERIKDLKTLLHLNVPNAFLADKLLTAIYGSKESQTPITSDAKQRVTVGGKTVVVDSIRVFEDQFEITYNGRILKGPVNQLSAVIAAIAIYEQKNNRNQEVPPGRSGVLPPLSPLRTVRDSFPSYGSSTSKVPLGGVPAINNCFTIHTDCQYGRSLRAHQLKAVICFPLFY